MFYCGLFIMPGIILSLNKPESDHPARPLFDPAALNLGDCRVLGITLL